MDINGWIDGWMNGYPYIYMDIYIEQQVSEASQIWRIDRKMMCSGIMGTILDAVESWIYILRTNLFVIWIIYTKYTSYKWYSNFYRLLHANRKWIDNYSDGGGGGCCYCCCTFAQWW